MRRRVIHSKIRSALRTFLAHKVGAIETCLKLAVLTRGLRPTPLPTDLEVLVEQVQQVTRGLTDAQLEELWHPNRLPEIFEQRRSYELEIDPKLRALCEPLLHSMLAMKRRPNSSPEKQEL